MLNDYASLSTRAGFNKSLGHFRMVSGLISRLDKGGNLAELLDDLEKNKGLQKSQIGPILNAVVIDRMDYRSHSFNLPIDSSQFDKIQEATAKWNKFDLLVAYHHPQLGISLINPKNKAQWDALQEINREELVVSYIKARREQDREQEQEALEALKDLIIGREVQGTDKFHDPELERKAAPPPPPPGPAAAAPQAPALPRISPDVAAAASTPPAAAPAPPSGPPAQAEAAAAPEAPAAAPAAGGGGKKRVTPKYSVQVTNELFHNGNVEAWKNIVESYKAKHAGLEVHIFHDGQKVNNINALFKWGKVKNGDVILFSVAGEEIKGVAKLQRYLFEGASLRFEKYLKKDVNKILNLFG
jgi:hypothetical protein